VNSTSLPSDVPALERFQFQRDAPYVCRGVVAGAVDGSADGALCCRRATAGPVGAAYLQSGALQRVRPKPLQVPSSLVLLLEVVVKSPEASPGASTRERRQREPNPRDERTLMRRAFRFELHPDSQYLTLDRSDGSSDCLLGAS
jgi:hypothetical protein